VEVADRVAELRAEFKGRSVILGVDDEDPIKGSLMKFRALRVFLENNPQWLGKICFVQIILPSTNPDTAHHALWEVRDQCSGV
jgi:trehalose-6-phosphate synthase